MANKKFITAFILILSLFSSIQVFAQGDSTSAVSASSGSASLNPAFLLLVSVALIFALLIAVLGYVLISISGIYLKNPLDNEYPSGGKSSAIKAAVMITGLIAVAGFANAQEPAAAAPATSIAGMTPTAFFLLILTIFIEIVVVFVLLWNISNLIKKSKQASRMGGKSKFQWWAAVIVAFVLFLNGIYILKFSGPEPVGVKPPVAKVEDVTENTVKILKDKADLDAGKEIFIKSCEVCHGPDGGGVIGPNLTDNYWLHGANIKNIFHTVHDGINAMPPWKTTYSNKEIEQVCSYVVSLHGTKPKNPKAPEGKEEAITDQGSAGATPATSDSTAAPAK